MSYRLSVIPRAIKDLEELEGKRVQQVTAAIRSLDENPRPPGSLKLPDEESGYRVRACAIRILYRVDDSSSESVIYRVKHRREAYRR